MERISLLDSLEREWIKILFSTVREAGPAAQTLGGVLKITNRETFVSQSRIASHARVPVRSVKRHLATLHDAGYLVNSGRQETRAGRLRRTATIKVTAKTRKVLKEGYGILPWWACCDIQRVGRLPWGSRVLVSVVMARLAAIKKAVETNGETVLDLDDLMDANHGDRQDRFRFSLEAMQDRTGLNRHTIVGAKANLYRHGIVTWEDGDGQADLLIPAEGFRVIVTPTGEGRCRLAFGEFDSGT